MVLLQATASLTLLGPSAARGGVEGAARAQPAQVLAYRAPASLLVSPLRAPRGVAPEGLDLSGGGAGLIDPGRSSGVDSGVACVVGALVPGLGHAILGQYLPRGLAFTSAFTAMVIGAVAAMQHANSSPALRGQLLFAGLVLLLAADVVYLWSVIDALMISSRPSPDRQGPGHLLGRD
ncbi:MAG: hypothetical protein P1V51_10480 [Deltaproteobacteria bacterium]|nr:hypothetical protein [Deltaproteobacteria bacterium]